MSRTEEDVALESGDTGGEGKCGGVRILLYLLVYVFDAHLCISTNTLHF